MRYFQIRVPAQSCLERILNETLKDIWMKMDYLWPSKENRDEDMVRLQDAFKSAMDKHIHEYSNCGLAEECHDDIEGGPWVDHNDRIYMLSLCDNYGSFIKEISTEALGTFIDGLDLERKAQLLSVFSGMLSHQLSKYVYFNPSCRRIPFCELQSL